ncbi:MAG TPA: RDD family protein [Micromonosporaceae bacterium]
MTLEAPAGTAAGTTDVGSRLVSGDAIALDIRFARLGSRAFARVLDLGAQLVIAVVLELLANIVVVRLNDDDSAVEQFIAVIVVVVTMVAYPVLLETVAQGRTLGKLAVGIRVVRDDGGPIRFRQALTRALVGLAAEFPGLLLPPFTWFAGVGTMLSNPAGKRLGDFAAGTIVIHDRSPETWGWVPTMPPELAGWASTLDLTGFSDSLALAVRNYLSRNRKIREPARTRLGTHLAAETAACVASPPPGSPGWAFLAAVMAERHRRSVARIGRARAATAAIWPELSALTAFPDRWAPTAQPVLPRPARGGLVIRAAAPELRRANRP